MMAKQNQSQDLKSKQNNQPRNIPAAMPEFAPGQDGLYEQPASRFSTGSSVLLDHQAARLGDTRWQTAQRQFVAQKMGHLQGNLYLQGIISTAKNNEDYAQRKPMPDFKNTSLATVHGVSLEPGVELSALEELVPPTDHPGRFKGFAHEYQALALASRFQTICAIIQDGEGLYHVFDTKWPSMTPGIPGSFAPHEVAGNHLVRFTNVLKRRTEKSWSEGVQTAINLYSNFETSGSKESRSAAERAYIELLIEALDLSAGEIHIVKSIKKDEHLDPKTVDEYISKLEPGKVNFDLLLSQALGLEGGTLKFTRGQQNNRPAPMVIGPGAFLRMSPQFLRRVVVHEVEHAVHHMQSMKLIEKWRRSRESAKTKYSDWLIQQRNRGRISMVEFELAMEQILGGEIVTQAFAHLRGFMSSFHVLPVEEAKHMMDDITEITSEVPLGKALNAVILSQLGEYYCALDAPHQKFFDQFVEKQLPFQFKQHQKELFQEMFRFRQKCKPR